MRVWCGGLMRVRGFRSLDAANAIDADPFEGGMGEASS